LSRVPSMSSASRRMEGVCTIDFNIQNEGSGRLRG
jgi:hypothetical protein